MRDQIYYGNVIQDLWGAISEGRPPWGRYCRRDSGGQHFLGMQRNMRRTVMFVREWGSHHNGMNFLYNQYNPSNPLRNGWLTLWDLSTHRYDTHMPSTSLPPLNTSQDVLKLQQFETIPQLLLPKLSLRTSSLYLGAPEASPMIRGPTSLMRWSLHCCKNSW